MLYLGVRSSFSQRVGVETIDPAWKDNNKKPSNGKEKVETTTKRVLMLMLEFTIM